MRDGEIFPLSAMNQGENAPPLHPRCRCTIVATFDSPGKRGKTSGERAARDENGRRTRVPADMTYKDWKAVYIDKSKTFDAWQKEMEAKYAAMPPTREQLRGREIIDKLSSGAPLTSIKPNDKVATGFDLQRFGTYEDQIKSHGGSGNIKPDKLSKDIVHATNHNFPKKHSFGKHGEHVHDVSWENGHIKWSDGKELTEAERKDSGDLL